MIKECLSIILSSCDFNRSSFFLKVVVLMVQGNKWPSITSLDFKKNNFSLKLHQEWLGDLKGK